MVNIFVYDYTATVKAFKPEEIKEIAINIRVKNSERKRRVLKKVADARAFLPILVANFKQIDPDIREIVLFGSLLEQEVRRENFDIDIAVSSDHYLTLVSWALNQEYSIDVVDIDSVPNHILEVIRQKGEVLYPRKE